METNETNETKETKGSPIKSGIKPQHPLTLSGQEEKKYGDVEIREILNADRAEEIYTHVRRDLKGGVLTVEVAYRLILIQVGTGQPPMLLLIHGAAFNPMRRGYVIQPLEEGDYVLLDLPENLPNPNVKDRLVGVVRENGADEFNGAKISGLNIQGVWRGLLTWNKQLSGVEGRGFPILFKAAPILPDEELMKVLNWDWEEYLHDLLFMGAEKDERIAQAGKSRMIPQFPEMRMKNSLSLFITNGGTGKSVLLSKVGVIYSQATQKSITGGAQPDGSVVPSFLMGLTRPAVVEHLEAKSEESLLTYLLTTISGVPSRIVVWQTEREFSPFCAVIVTGNPNRERGQLDFQAFFTYLQGISANYVAMGRRVSLILFGRDYATVKRPTDPDNIPWVDPAWSIWWEIAARIEPLVKEIYGHSDVRAWINSRDEAYARAVEKVYGEEERSEVGDFWVEHGRNAYPAMKWRSLCCALVDHGKHLLHRVLSGQGVDRDLGEAILARAKEVYEEVKVMNLRSLRAIQETPKLDETILTMVFQNLPRYLKEILITVGHYATRDGARIEFPVEALRETFEEIKGPLGLYSGLSIILQHLDRHKPHLKYGDKLALFSVSLQQTQGIWSIRLTSRELSERLVSLLSLLSLLSLGYKPSLSPALTEEWVLERVKQEAESQAGPGRLQENLERGLTWLSDRGNLDEDSSADLDEFQRIVGGHNVVEFMEKKGLIMLHPKRRGRVLRR